MVVDDEHCPECGHRWVQLRPGVVGCLYMAGHHNRQIVYSLTRTSISFPGLPVVEFPKGKKRRRNNLKPKQKRALLMLLAERDGNWHCRYCHRGLTPITDNKAPLDSKDPDIPTIDHVIPLSRGGTHDLDNLCIACRACNNDKGDRLG